MVLDKQASAASRLCTVVTAAAWGAITREQQQQ
jgi:hypothetical protein